MKINMWGESIMENLTCGEKLTDARKSKNLFGKDVAEMLDIQPATLSNYENDKNLPETENLIKLSDFYELSMDYLCGRIPYHVDLAKLNRPFFNDDEILVGELLEQICGLNDDNKTILLTTLKLLKKNEGK